jgi:predicted SAM-dependent methyltransferase/rubredoxin
MKSFKIVVKNLLRPSINYLHIWLNPGKYRLGNFHCPVCQSDVRYFNRLPDKNFEMLYKYQCIHPISCFETINPFDYSCPKCGVTDRDRLYALYLRKYLLMNGSIDFLDIAPRKPLTKLITSFSSVVSYRSADLNRTDVDDRVDITDMKKYEDNRFDFIICSHVLEHVSDDRKAMRELFRVMKPGGRAIMMVPILLTLEEDYENPEIIMEEDKWKHYGQGDHVRMYSRNGFIRKLKDVGFKVKEFGESYFGGDVFKKCGITERSVLYVVEK